MATSLAIAAVASHASHSRATPARVGSHATASGSSAVRPAAPPPRCQPRPRSQRWSRAAHDPDGGGRGPESLLVSHAWDRRRRPAPPHPHVVPGDRQCAPCSLIAVPRFVLDELHRYSSLLAVPRRPRPPGRSRLPRPDPRSTPGNAGRRPDSMNPTGRPPGPPASAALMRHSAINQQPLTLGSAVHADVEGGVTDDRFKESGSPERPHRSSDHQKTQHSDSSAAWSSRFCSRWEQYATDSVAETPREAPAFVRRGALTRTHPEAWIAEEQADQAMCGRHLPHRRVVRSHAPTQRRLSYSTTPQCGEMCRDVLSSKGPLTKTRKQSLRERRRL